MTEFQVRSYLSARVSFQAWGLSLLCQEQLTWGFFSPFFWPASSYLAPTKLYLPVVMVAMEPRLALNTSALEAWSPETVSMCLGPFLRESL